MPAAGARQVAPGNAVGAGAGRRVLRDGPALLGSIALVVARRARSSSAILASGDAADLKNESIHVLVLFCFLAQEFRVSIGSSSFRNGWAWVLKGLGSPYATMYMSIAVVVVVA